MIVIRIIIKIKNRGMLYASDFATKNRVEKSLSYDVPVKLEKGK